MFKKNGIAKKILLIAGLLAITVIIAFGITLTVNTELSNPTNLDEFLNRKFEKLGVAGMAVTVINGDEVLSFHGFGMADIENSRPVTIDTVFAMASTSKPVTAVAVMKLEEAGLLNLDEDIGKYLPFGVRNPNHPDDKITVKMLLTHTSSITDNWDVYDPLYTLFSGGGDSSVSLADFFRNYLSPDGIYYDAEQNFSAERPGTERLYSNCGFGLLGYIVEEVSGMPFPQYCRNNIFKPLGMDNTAWMISDTDADKMAKPYNGKEEALPHYSFPTYPDGGLRTTSDDFAKFISMMMGGGVYKGVRVLEEPTVVEMTEPQAIGVYENQGLSWELRALEEFKIKCSEPVIGHSGGDYGIASYAFYVPRTQRGAVVMINQDMKMVKLLNYILILKRLKTEIS